MKRSIARFIYTKVLGWRYSVTVPDYDKCIICAAPHTSNWDFIIGKLFYSALGRKTFFLMKSEWFFFPLGMLLRRMGEIPVKRDKRTSLVEQMVDRIRTTDKISIAITPEGTRSPNPEWKKGFYYMAHLAGIPIVLIGIDYVKKTIYADKAMMPSGNVDDDIRYMKQYFKQYTGRHPWKYAV